MTELSFLGEISLPATVNGMACEGNKSKYKNLPLGKKQLLFQESERSWKAPYEIGKISTHN